MPLLPCPHCDRKVPVTISQAGSQITCPACQQAVPVPKLGDLRKLPDEPSTGPASSPGGSAGTLGTSAAAGNRGNRIVFAGALAIAGIMAISGMFCLVRYLAIEVKATTQSHIEEIERAYKQVPAAQLVREWQQMEKYGLDVAAPYAYQKQQNEKADWGRNGLICLTVFLIASGIAAVLGARDSRLRSSDRSGT